MVSRPPTEDELVERARDGDATAFSALVRDHQEIAFRTAYLITRNAADAEDAAQVGLTKAWRALPRFRRRLAAAAVAARDRRERGAQPPARRGSPRRALSSAPSTSFPRGARLRLPRGASSPPRSARSCSAALERLSDDDRLVLSCRYLLELSEEETANVLSVRRGTVKSRTSRALERLRGQLEQPGESDV